MRDSILTIVIVILFSACNSQKALTSRYKSIKYDSANRDNLVAAQVYSYPIIKEEEDDKNVFNLSPRGQQALINAVNSKEKETDDVIGKVSSSLSSSDEPVKVIDKTKIKRRLVFAVKNLSDTPGNRISKINLNLQLADSSNIKYKTWNQISTQYQNVDIAKVTYGKTNNLTISPSLSTGTGVTNADASGKTGSLTLSPGSYSHQTSLSEEVDLKQRYVALSGTLTKGTANLYQESTDGQDLTGNIIADV